MRPPTRSYAARVRSLNPSARLVHQSCPVRPPVHSTAGGRRPAARLPVCPLVSPRARAHPTCTPASPSYCPLGISPTRLPAFSSVSQPARPPVRPPSRPPSRSPAARLSAIPHAYSDHPRLLQDALQTASFKVFYNIERRPTGWPHRLYTNAERCDGSEDRSCSSSIHLQN